MAAGKIIDRDIKAISKDIGNALKEELERSPVAKFATVQNEGGSDRCRLKKPFNMILFL